MNTSKPKFKLIIGLGNPNPEYQNTYHNVGHLFVDYLISQTSNVSAEGGSASGGKCQMLKSDVYMNASGAFVKKTLKKYNVKPEELLIAHDDSDIALGNYKLSFGRNAAGHHGIENIMATLKTKNFWRLRIGIRSGATSKKLNPSTPAPERSSVQGTASSGNKAKRLKAGEFVLKKIGAADKKILGAVFQKAAEL